MKIIGRAGASPPSRATVKFFYIYIFLTDRVYTYRIVLNVSTRFYFSVYTTISLVPRTDRACVRLLLDSQLPSIMPSISVTVNSDSASSTTHDSLCLNGINSVLRFVSTCDNHAMCFSTVNNVHNLLRYLSV